MKQSGQEKSDSVVEIQPMTRALGTVITV